MGIAAIMRNFAGYSGCADFVNDGHGDGNVDGDSDEDCVFDGHTNSTISSYVRLRSRKNPLRPTTTYSDTVPLLRPHFDCCDFCT